MLGMLVWYLSLILILRPSISMPNSSAPRPSRYSRRPTQTRTTSASKLSLLPPSAASVLTLRPLAVFSTPVTLVFILKFKPCFFSKVMNCLATSPSMPRPPMVPMNSTTVTSAPSLAQTDPNSRPMTPPPMTVILLGTFSKAKAPVEETMVFSSSSMPGKLTTSEPVAKMMFLASIFSSPPSKRLTVTVFLSVNLPWPFT
mmetsp:Transcript_38730/g.82269  ORF Transcript_38730/g.82269 Transcript_38730/m.82269 type:complete len:200 (+) Transcript_38730:589-1188(+)